MPSAVGQAIKAFIKYYNHQRYYETLGNVTLADVYFGNKDDIMAIRKVIKNKTLHREGHRPVPVPASAQLQCRVSSQSLVEGFFRLSITAHYLV